VVPDDPGQAPIAAFSGEESVEPREKLWGHRRIREQHIREPYPHVAAACPPQVRHLGQKARGVREEQVRVLRLHQPVGDRGDRLRPRRLIDEEPPGRLLVPGIGDRGPARGGIPAARV